MGTQTTAYYSNSDPVTYDITGSLNSNVINTSNLIKVETGSTVSAIGQDAFRNAGNLLSVVLNDEITSIGFRAFQGCTLLESINIPDSVVSIGEYSFSYCSALTSMTIPSRVSAIGGACFAHSYYIRSIYISKDSPITAINGSTFFECRNLSSIVIPYKVTRIKNQAFYGCSSLSSISCYAITAPTVEYDHVYGHHEAFARTGINTQSTGNNVLKLLPNSTGYDSGDWLDPLQLNNGFHIEYMDDCTLAHYSTGDVVPYDIVGTLNAGVIDLTDLVKVEIGNTVTSIGDNAFDGCSSLESVTIPSSVTSIGSSAFLGCSSLSSIVNYANLSSIGGSAFQSCSSLTHVDYLGSITNIEYALFSNCINLTSIVIPNSVLSIDVAAFSNCSSISTIIIPSGVNNIGDGVFIGCTNLSSIDCDRMTAPTIGYGIFGVESTTYTGRNTYDTGHNILKVYQGATGYDTGEWLDPLCNADKCGFNIQRKPVELSVITGLAGDPFETEIVFPVSPGQEFMGWNIPIPETFTPYDMKFYPIIGNNSSITFNTSPGKFPNGSSIAVYTREIGSPTEFDTNPPPNPERTGYNFSNWDTDPLPEVFPEKNMEIESIWSPLTNQITFNYNGGKIGNTTSSVSTLTYDSSWPTAPNITTPKNCTVSFVTAATGSTAAQTSSFNLTFNGYWSTTASGGTKYYTNTRTPTQVKFTGDSDIIAYAGWSGVRAPNSGNFSYSPSRTGYTFDGWYENQSRTGSKITYYSSLTANKTLYAKWTEITSKSVTISNISKSATENNKTSGGKTYTYTLTIPSSQFSSVPSTLHLKSIEVYLYAYTNNSKSTSLSVSLGSTTVSISPAAKAGSSASATKTISGNFTSYKYNTNIPLTIKFYLAKGNDHHKGNFTVKVNKVTFGK